MPRGVIFTLQNCNRECRHLEHRSTKYVSVKGKEYGLSQVASDVSNPIVRCVLVVEVCPPLFVLVLAFLVNHLKNLVSGHVFLSTVQQLSIEGVHPMTHGS